MKISTKGRYGLRVMVELASRYGRGPVSVESISKNHGISGKYIRVLVTGLRLAGLIRTVRGPSGGYELARDPSNITALDIVSVLEGRCEPAPCVTDVSLCTRSRSCATADLWRGVAQAVDRVLERTTLRELASRQSAISRELVSFEI